METAEHVILYLHDDGHKTITYTRGSRKSNELWGWVDADWAGDTETHRSHTGCILIMNGRPISLKIHCHDNVSLSTSETKLKLVTPSQVRQETGPFIFMSSSRIVATNKILPLKSIKTTCVISPREGKLWNFSVTHNIHKRFFTESTGSTQVGKEERDTVDTVYTHLF